MKDGFYETKVKVTKEQAEDIERDTREQSESELWRNERRKCITASQVGAIVKMRKTTKRSGKVKGLLYSQFKGNKATRCGIHMEETLRKQYLAYQQQMGNPEFTTQRVGLVISVDNPWIAASPDDRAIDRFPGSSIAWYCGVQKSIFSEGPHTA